MRRGGSPSQTSPSTILHMDLYGTAAVLEEFGGAGLQLTTRDVTQLDRESANVEVKRERLPEAALKMTGLQCSKGVNHAKAKSRK